MLALRAIALVLIGFVAACGDDSPPRPSEPPDASVPLTCDTTGFVPCGDVCVRPATDPAHCGACNKACATGEACVEAVCIAVC